MIKLLKNSDIRDTIFSLCVTQSSSFLHPGFIEDPSLGFISRCRRRQKPLINNLLLQENKYPIAGSLVK